MNFEHDLEVFVREVVQNSLDARRIDRLPVRVVFDLQRLDARRKRAFLKAVDWASLRPHVEASRRWAPAFRDALQRIDAPNEPFVILTIHDGPALGLSGDERGRGRFAMFARNKLLSDKEGKDAGGSYGLGKSVLWAFSGMSTIFVHSQPHDRSGPRDRRFIGIAQLPWHELEGRDCDGPGWFGAPQVDVGTEWSTSFAPELDLLSALHLAREPELDTGTSICIPDFQADGEPAEIAAELERAAAKWFWPALAGTDPLLQIELRWSGRCRIVDPSHQPDLRPFLHLAGLDCNPDWVPQMVHAEQALKLPAVRETMREDESSFEFHDAIVVEDAIGLDALQLEQDPGELSRTLALMRGARMVVRYVKLPTEQPAFALARAGIAHGNRGIDRWVEQFLRHAEPPSHDDWAPNAPKLHDRYKRGYGTELKGLKKRLADAAVVLLRRRDSEQTKQEMPAALRKVMAVSVGASRGDGGREGRFDYRITDCRLIDSRDDPGWQFSGWVQNTRGGPWLLEAEGWLEGDGARIDLPVKGMRSDDAKACAEGLRIEDDGRVDFSGFCSIASLGELAGRAVFGVQLRRRMIHEDASDHSGGPPR